MDSMSMAGDGLGKKAVSRLEDTGQKGALSFGCPACWLCASSQDRGGEVGTLFPEAALEQVPVGQGKRAAVLTF